MEERNRSPDDRMEALKEQHYFEIIHMFAKFSSPKLGSGGSFNCVSRGASTRKNKEKPKNLVLHLKQYIKTRRKLDVGLMPIPKIHFFIPKKPTKSWFHEYGSWYETQPNLSFGYGYESQT